VPQYKLMVVDRVRRLQAFLKSLYRALLPAPLRNLIREIQGRGERIRRSARADAMLFTIGPTSSPLSSLKPFENNIRSQNGEDGVIEAIFAKIGTTNRFFVEFGVEDGSQCNTAHLIASGWDGLQMDGAEGNPEFIKQEFIAAENINDLFRKYAVPRTFDLLSIDIDGNDYWVWKAIDGFTPRVVVIEYNGSIPPRHSIVIPYDSTFRYDNTLPLEPGGYAFFGASLAALEKLGREKGYALVYCERRGVNAFFVQRDLAEAHFGLQPLRRLYRHATHPHSHKTLSSWQKV
jgi:hypothetical protein